MKKIFTILICLLLLSGCSCTNKMTAKEAVAEYIERYRTQDEAVIDSLDEYIKTQDEMSDRHKDKYREVLIKQYKNIKYKITNETYDGDEALISVNITVFDLYKAQIEANQYLNDNLYQFTDENGIYDKDLFLDYKLDLMNKYTNTTEYNINFHVKKNDKDRWEVQPLSTDDLEKIHGIYQYES